MIGPSVEFMLRPGRSQKLYCSVCGRGGYGTGSKGWQTSHLRGHRQCPDCGKWLTVLLDGSARTHARCKNKRADPSSD